MALYNIKINENLINAAYGNLSHTCALWNLSSLKVLHIQIQCMYENKIA